MDEASSVSWSRIGIAPTAPRFIAMILAEVLDDRVPTMASLVAMLVFMIGILLILIRGGDRAVVVEEKCTPVPDSA